MKWLLIYTHAYDKALKYCEYHKSQVDYYHSIGLTSLYMIEYRQLKRYESILRFIEKRIKLIKYE